ncbi:MAG: dihydrolipoamide acetyltransferase family protein, partial [Wolbachia sp.]
GGKIVKWHKKEQDKVEVGDVIAEIETDKAIMEFESVDEGVVAKILVTEGTSGVPVNQPIALMLEEGEDENALNNYTSTSINSAVKKEVTKCAVDNQKSEHQDLNGKPISHSSVSFQRVTLESNLSMSSQCLTLGSRKEEDTKTTEGRIKISPLAKKIAQNEGVNVQQLKGTGPYGRIIKADVLEFLGSGIHTESPEIVEVSNIRQVIAQRLTESKQNVPHFYLTVDCQVDKLISLKNEINSADENNKVTINDLIIKAVAFSMKKFPDINSSWIDNKILKYSNVDISIAVALEDGLITPIVKNADKKGILSISKEVKDLVSRARSG